MSTTRILASLLVVACGPGDEPMDSGVDAVTVDGAVHVDGGVDAISDGGPLNDGALDVAADAFVVPTSCDFPPLADDLLDRIEALALNETRADFLGAATPHLQAHPAEINYASSVSTYDTSWKPGEDVIAGQLTFASDDPTKVLRCTRGGTTGDVEPVWNVDTTGDTTVDGGAEWIFAGFPGASGVSPDHPVLTSIGQAQSHYDPMACLHHAHAFLESRASRETARFDLYRRYVRSWRDVYAVPNDYGINSIFSGGEGFYLDHLNLGSSDPDATTAEQVDRLSRRMTFGTINQLSRTSADGVPTGYNQRLSREVAHVLKARVFAERAGVEREIVDPGAIGETFDNSFVSVLVELAANHFYEWRHYDYLDPSTGRWAPFMMGLTMDALALYYDWELENGRDPNRYWPARIRRMHPERAADNPWPTIHDAFGDLLDHMDVADNESGAYPMTGRSEAGYLAAIHESVSDSGNYSASLNALWVSAYGFVAREFAREGDCDSAARWLERGDEWLLSIAMDVNPSWKAKEWFQQWYSMPRYLAYREQAAAR